VRAKVAINYVIGSILIVTVITGAKMSLSEVDKYGWIYDRTITVGADVFMERVSIKHQLYAEAFMFITGAMLIITGLDMRQRGIDTTHHLSNIADITFAAAEPTHWDIWYDPDKGIIGVILDDIGISFPLKMFNKWIIEPEVA